MNSDGSMKVIRSDDRGRGNHGWLDSRHTFSFAGYWNPDRMGFRALRVINDDRVVGGAGFPPHGHRDMEIISYVLEGALEHKDSLGFGSVVRPGEVQRMSAGTGISHSEYNAHQDVGLRFLQIWLKPDRTGYEPDYEQKTFDREQRHGRLRLVVSPDGSDGSLTVRQDARLYSALLDSGQSVTHALQPGRGAWLHVARGRVRVGDVALSEGDSAAFESTPDIRIAGEDSAEILLFDLA